MSTADDGKACCGCCAGTGGPTPVFLENRPGLSALAYRVGTHARFKEAMLAAISAKPALRALTTRDDDDPTIALLDAWATTLDVLTFYQERIANEAFLRTATERRSLLELARTIGYELRPGVASSTWLAFTVDGSPGSPREVIIPAGTRAQSLPTKSELPQSFETGEPLLARPEWNALRPRQKEPQVIGATTDSGSTEILLASVATQLRAGDALLVAANQQSFDLRVLTAVEPRPKEGVTRVAWKDELTVAADPAPKVYALRQRAALFGANAPDWKSMAVDFKVEYTRAAYDLVGPPQLEPDWPFFQIQNLAEKKIDLDASYPRIAPETWLILKTSGAQQLFEVTDVETVSRSDYSLSARVTRLTLDKNIPVSAPDQPIFGLRETAVFAESEELTPAPQVIAMPIEGNTIELDGLALGLNPGRAVIVQGRRMRAIVGPAPTDEEAEPISLQVGGGSIQVPLEPGESLVVLSAPVPLAFSMQRWHLRRRDGVEGFVVLAAFVVQWPGAEPSFAGGEQTLTVVSSEEGDPETAEVAFLKEATSARERTTLKLTAPLANLFDRTTALIFANVAPASHGETKREVLGGGNASKKFQRFHLRQKPLTYVAAPVAGGGASTLELRVNGVLWHEAPNLYGLGPRDRKYVLRRDDEGNTTVGFGDGVHGARLPSGVENIEAVYRTGIGLTGLVGEDRISLLATRPLGVRSVTNPVAASGAADPESRDLARGNAPMTVLTLDRAVSLRDYEDFARSFSGIGKAQARMLWERGRRLVHLTIAGVDGLPVDPNSILFINLRLALDRLRDPFQELKVAFVDRLLFRVGLRVKVDPDHVQESVLQRVEAALREAFSFAARDLGQSVHLSEVMAVAQRVEGVVYVDVDQLYQDGSQVTLADRLPALPARIDAGKIRPAQSLLLSPAPVAPEAIL